MKDDVCPAGPFKTELSILYLDDEGNEARVAYTLAAGKFPTKEAVRKAIAEATRAVPSGFRLANRHEFIEAELGVGHVAVPGPKEFPVESEAA